MWVWSNCASPVTCNVLNSVFSATCNVRCFYPFYTLYIFDDAQLIDPLARAVLSQLTVPSSESTICMCIADLTSRRSSASWSISGCLGAFGRLPSQKHIDECICEMIWIFLFERPYEHLASSTGLHLCLQRILPSPSPIFHGNFFLILVEIRILRILFWRYSAKAWHLPCLMRFVASPARDWIASLAMSLSFLEAKGTRGRVFANDALSKLQTPEFALSRG